MRPTLTVLFVALCLFFAACGKKGPLYLPDPGNMDGSQENAKKKQEHGNRSP